MVDVKREDITLQDRTKGISADEFAWGSYFYSEAISSWYNSKGFELWYNLHKTALNSRTNGKVVALSTAWGNGFSAFTSDGKIEMQADYNSDKKGAYYSVFVDETNRNFLNWLSYGNYFYGITQDKVIKLPAFNIYDISTDLISNPNFSSWGAWWTIWTWWTITGNWAEHATGNTGTLVSNIDWSGYSSDSYFRVALKITNWTAGSVTIKWLPAYTLTYNYHKEGRYVGSLRGSTGTNTLTITPTSTFDGTIERAEVYLYDTSDYASISLAWNTTSYTHPAIMWEWDLYVACGSYVNIVNLADNGVITKHLVDDNFTIKAMNQQAWNIILWATDGHDSRQYYWNWVDAVATEVIEWKGLIIQSACGTETVSYVLTTSWATSGSVEWYEYRLYAVSWYQRNLIASKLFQSWTEDYLDKEPYNINKRFDFNDVEDDHWMIIFLDSLYTPWCDGVYKYWYDVPWLRSAWTRPIKYDTWATDIVMGQRWHFLGVAFRVSGTSYIWEVDNRLYAPNWYLVSESIYRDKLSTRKALEKLKIWYKNVASTVGNIKVYAIVDDNYFRRFRPTSTPTTRPSVWDVYEVANNTTAKVIDVDKTNWVITLVTVSNMWSYEWAANTTLTKVSGDGDNSIAVGYNYDNMCLIKTIESDVQGYGSDLIFGKNFVSNYIPYRHKIQFVVELNSNNSRLSPEIYEISMISDITDTVL